MTRWSHRLTILALFAPLAAAGTETWKPQPLERGAEIDAALEACPPILREEAGVYVLTPAGYELARAGRNHFHAIVERSQRDAFEPQCLDAVGSETLLDRILLRGRLQMAGASRDEIERELGRAWEDGRLRAPSRPGINYMLSERNLVPVGPDQVIPYQPHVMLYAPYLTNTDVGGDLRGAGSPVFVVNEGEPGAYLIVPVGSGDGH